jgi:hypothetical protein
MRERLENRRRCESFEFVHAELRFTLTFSRYSDGRVSEIFLSSHKPGSAIESVVRDAAILTSIALQFGAPIETIRHGLTRDDAGRPATAIGAALDALAMERRP